MDITCTSENPGGTGQRKSQSRSQGSTLVSSHLNGIIPHKERLNETKEAEKKFGIIILRTNIINKPASDIYQIYKVQGDVEQLFNILRNTCEQDASYMRDDAGFEAWSFFGHITMSIACRMLAKLKELELLKEWSLEALLDHLVRIHVVQINEEWRIAETTKKTRELIAILGF